MHLKPDKSIEDLSRMFNPIIRGWINYYGKFYQSHMYSMLRYFNRSLVHWVRRKYKRYACHQMAGLVGNYLNEKPSTSNTTAFFHTINEIDGNNEWLYKFVIPIKSTTQIAHELEIMGFRRGDLFPDLDNLSTELKGRYKVPTK